MPGKVSPTLRALLEIRDQIIEMKGEIRELRRSTDERFEQVAVELLQVSGAVNGVRDLLRERLDLRDQVEDHELRIAALEGRRGGRGR